LQQLHQEFGLQLQTSLEAEKIPRHSTLDAPQWLELRTT
jgi:hypothetical protein